MPDEKKTRQCRFNVERALLPAAFDLSVVLDFSLHSEKIKVKSSGQECPLHISTNSSEH
jgi:hypothetical protein